MQGQDGQPGLVPFPLPHPAFLDTEPSRFLMGRQPCELLAQRSGGVSFLRIMRLERVIRDGRQTDRQDVPFLVHFYTLVTLKSTAICTLRLTYLSPHVNLHWLLQSFLCPRLPPPHP